MSKISKSSKSTKSSSGWDFTRIPSGGFPITPSKTSANLAGGLVGGLLNVIVEELASPPPVRRRLPDTSSNSTPVITHNPSSGNAGPWGPRGIPSRTSDIKNTPVIPAKPEPPTYPFDDAGFRASLQSLQDKKPALPQEFGEHIDSIVKSGENILHCMRTDPQDIKDGERFLKRYLKACHELLDAHRKLSVEAPKSLDLQNHFDRAMQLLARLAAAFSAEHANLLKNDVMNFSADMNTLDKLLKMDGF